MLRSLASAKKHLFFSGAEGELGTKDHEKAWKIVPSA
jgi:hypothetical protein